MIAWLLLRSHIDRLAAPRGRHARHPRADEALLADDLGDRRPEVRVLLLRGGGERRAVVDLPRAHHLPGGGGGGGRRSE